jgi:heat shock protein HtpX
MFELIRANQRRAALLVVAMAALLAAVGFAVGEVLAPGDGGVTGLGAGLLLWGILGLVAYGSGDTIFLGLVGARKIEKKDHPVLWNVVEEMTIAAGLPKMPDVYIIDKDALNAFATGRGPDRASIAVTSGLLEKLDRDELQGVVAHELGHVKNRDILYLMLLGAMAGAIVILADVGRRVLWYGPPRRRTSDKGSPLGAVILIAAVLLIALAPLLAHLLQLAVSRRREYLADACGAQFTRYPEGLASALEKIGRYGGALKDVSRTVAPSFISDPLAKASLDGEASSWGSTHPPLAERIRILRAMAGIPGYVRYDEAFRTITRRPVGVMPASALAEAPEAERGARLDPRTRVDRVRDATDAIWQVKDYAFVPCACGTTLKLPPAWAGRQVACPHCGTTHVAGAPSPG